MKILLIVAACVLATPSMAEDKMPVPKVFQGMGTQKGQWKVDFLEASGARADKPRPSMTICSDNLARQSQNPQGATKAQSECKYRVLKDTATESIVESTCRDRTTVVKTTRESEKSLLMEMEGKGEGSRQMKMRYTHLGPCREGQGTFSLDKDSEQCRKVRERAAKMDPEKQCAKSKQREQCLEQMQAAQKQLAGMCN